MCLAIPARVIELTGDDGIVDAMGSQWPIKTSLCPEIKCGQLALVHAGFAVAAISEDEAKYIWPLIAQLNEFQNNQQV